MRYNDVRAVGARPIDPQNAWLEAKQFFAFAASRALTAADPGIRGDLVSDLYP